MARRYSRDYAVDVKFTGAINKAGHGEYAVKIMGREHKIWVLPKGAYRSAESLDAAACRALGVRAVRRERNGPPRLQLILGGLVGCPSSAAPC